MHACILHVLSVCLTRDAFFASMSEVILKKVSVEFEHWRQIRANENLHSFYKFSIQFDYIERLIVLG